MEPARSLALLAATIFVCAGSAFAAPSAQDEIWPKLREALFGERAIQQDDQGLRLELVLPQRAFDAGVVPLGLRFQFVPGEPRLRKLYLVIDKNPSPVGAIFEFGDARDSIEFETRVRVEDYTWVRVIAEREDGSLISTRRYIKASGGCSAPAGKTMVERMAGIGKIKWQVDEPKLPGTSAAVQLMIRHPNISGLAMDQLTRLYDPPMFVNEVRVTRGGMLVFGAHVDFTISENPVFRFTVSMESDDELVAEITDTDGRRFESAFRVTEQLLD